MKIETGVVSDFAIGNNGADAVSKPVVAVGWANNCLKGVRIRAASANASAIYVGRPGVTVTSGYPLPAGTEIEIPIDNPSKIHVVATPAGNSTQVITPASMIDGDTFMLTFMGENSAVLAYNAAAAAVEVALCALATIGAGNCTVAGNAGGPYTVTFTGALAKTDVLAIVGTAISVNETQKIVVTQALAGDKLVLTFGAESTAELAYDATPAEVAAALNALSTIGNVVVTDAAPGWNVTFAIPSNTDVAAISGTCEKNEKQSVTLDADVTGGTFTLTYAGQTTAAIAFDASTAAVDAALEALNNIDPNDLTVTGVPGAWVVEFGGTLAKTDLVMMTADGALLTGALDILVPVEDVKGHAGTNEQQSITLDPSVTGGTFTISYAGQTTAAIDFNAIAADVDTALEALNNIDPGDVTVSGDPGAWVVEFTGLLAKTDVALMTADGAALTGALDVVTITETNKGEVGENEVQTITLDAAATSGTFTITYDGQTTAAIAFDASAATVETELKALINIEDIDVDVTGVAGAWVVEFTGQFVETDVAAMTATGSLSGAMNVVTPVVDVAGLPVLNEKQSVTLHADVTGGTFTLTYAGQTTAAIAFNAALADVDTALEALINIDPGDLTVTGVPGAWVVEFGGTLASTDVALMTATATGLTGALNTVAIVETVKGNEATVTITEEQKGDTCTIAVTKADASVGTLYSWIAC